MATSGALLPSRLVHLSMTIRVSLESSFIQITAAIQFIPASPLEPTEARPFVLFTAKQSVNLSGASVGIGGTLPVTVTDGVLFVGGVVSALVPAGVALSAGGLIGD